MKQIKLNLKDETYESLEREFKNFVRLSTRVDSGFVAPSFDSFLLARLSENPTFLTEEAVQHLMLQGQYAWAKRALEKDFPDVVAILISQAADYGFHIAVSHTWKTDDLVAASKAWATAIVKQAQGDERQIDVLAAQIKEAAVSINIVQEKLRTPATRLAHALKQQLHDVSIALDHADGVIARERLGSLRSLLKLSVAYGSMREEDEQAVLDQQRARKPELFMVPEASGFWDRAAAWWRSVFA